MSTEATFTKWAVSTRRESGSLTIPRWCAPNLPMPTRHASWRRMGVRMLSAYLPPFCGVCLVRVKKNGSNPGSREVCRRALTIGIAAARVVVCVILGVRTGIIDLSGQEQTGRPASGGRKIESSFANTA